MPKRKGMKYALADNQTEAVMTYIHKAFGCVRKLKNIYVESIYKQLEESDYKDGFIKLKLQEVSRIKEQFDYMKEIDSLAYANAKKHIESALSKYNKDHLGKGFTKRSLKRQKTLGLTTTFRDLKGMPSFSSKEDKQSFTTNNQFTKSKTYTVKLDGNKLYIPKLKEPILLNLHRPLPEGWTIKSVTISRNAHEDYFASLLVEAPEEELIIPRKPQKVIALDYAQKDFYVDNEGKRANYPHYYKQAERKLKKLQRQLSCKQKESSNYNKLKDKVQALHLHVANQRLDFTHKLSRELANNYDYVIVEDINLRNMAGRLRLAKNLHDNGFGMFRTFLSYKLEDRGGKLIKIDKMYPSSKTCSACGGYHETLTLKDRVFVCPHCGIVMNRDENAALNIKAEGLRLLGCI